MPKPQPQTLQPCVPQQFSLLVAGNCCHIDMFGKNLVQALKWPHFRRLNCIEQLMDNLKQELTGGSMKHPSLDNKKDNEMGRLEGCSQ